MNSVTFSSCALLSSSAANAAAGSIRVEASVAMARSERRNGLSSPMGAVAAGGAYRTSVAASRPAALPAVRGGNRSGGLTTSGILAMPIG